MKLILKLHQHKSAILRTTERLVHLKFGAKIHLFIIHSFKLIIQTIISISLIFYQYWPVSISSNSRNLRRLINPIFAVHRFLDSLQIQTSSALYFLPTVSLKRCCLFISTIIHFLPYNTILNQLFPTAKLCTAFAGIIIIIILYIE